MILLTWIRIDQILWIRLQSIRIHITSLYTELKPIKRLQVYCLIKGEGVVLFYRRFFSVLIQCDC